MLNHDQIRITDHDHGHIRKRMISDHQTKSISEEAMKKLQKLKTPNLWKVLFLKSLDFFFVFQFQHFLAKIQFMHKRKFLSWNIFISIVFIFSLSLFCPTYKYLKTLNCIVDIVPKINICYKNYFLNWTGWLKLYWFLNCTGWLKLFWFLWNKVFKLERNWFLASNLNF